MARKKAWTPITYSIEDYEKEYSIEWDVRQREVIQLFNIRQRAIELHYICSQLTNIGKDFWRYLNVLAEYWMALRPYTTEQKDKDIEKLRLKYFELLNGSEFKDIYSFFLQLENLHKELELIRKKVGLGIQIEEEVEVVEE